MNELIYLAIPYSHPNPGIRDYRLHLVSDIAGKLMNEGKVVFSPISHGYVIAQHHNLPTDWSYWEQSCVTFLSRCDRLIVVTTDGWVNSFGVQEEIRIANEMGIPIEYYSVEDNSI
jgi:hypothetical protein